VNSPTIVVTVEAIENLTIYSLLKMAAEKGGVPEVEVVQNRQFISTDG